MPQVSGKSVADALRGAIEANAKVTDAARAAAAQAKAERAPAEPAPASPEVPGPTGTSTVATPPERP